MRLLLFTFLILTYFNIHGQENTDTTACIYEYNGGIEKIEENIEFIISYNNEIDMANTNCIAILNETISYFSENMKTNTLCLIYMIGERDSQSIKFINLFSENDEIDILIDKIQMVHFIDKTSGYMNTFIEKSEIIDLFKRDIRKGLK